MIYRLQREKYQHNRVHHFSQHYRPTIYILERHNGCASKSTHWRDAAARSKPFRLCMCEHYFWLRVFFYRHAIGQTARSIFLSFASRAHYDGVCVDIRRRKYGYSSSSSSAAAELPYYHLTTTYAHIGTLSFTDTKHSPWGVPLLPIRFWVFVSLCG